MDEDPAPAAHAVDGLVLRARRCGKEKTYVVDRKWQDALLEAYHENPYPSKETCVELAWNLRVPRYAVDNWYDCSFSHNRRPSSDDG